MKKKINGRSYGSFNPVAKYDIRLFKVVLRGENHINGFRNRDIREQFFKSQPADKRTQLKNSSRVTRLLNKLRAHGLVARIPRTRKWRITKKGQSVMSTSILLREKGFAEML